MSLGIDIMEAVCRGGSERWSAEYKHKPHKEKKPNKNHEEYKKNLSEILKVMGNKRWTNLQISEILNIPKDTAYHRLKCLVDRNEIKRTQKAPYLYWRI